MAPTRAVRAQVLSFSERPWIDVARLNGIGSLRLIATELLPNLAPYLAASFVVAVSTAMLATIGLEALGRRAAEPADAGHDDLLGAVFRRDPARHVVVVGPPVAVLVVIFVACWRCRSAPTGW